MELEYIKTDKNGTKYYADWNCPRCAGAGASDKWINTGKTCYRCGGSGKRINPKMIKEYTGEYGEKLAAKRAAKAAERQAAIDAEQQAIEAEAAAARKAEEEAAAAAKAAEEARKAISKHYGTIGSKVELQLTVAAVISYEVPSFSGYGTTTKRAYIFTDSSGNKFAWHTTAFLELNDICAHEGASVVIKATIKAHDIYKGEKQTTLMRCKATSIINAE